MYLGIFSKLRLRERDLIPYESGDLVALNKFSIHSSKFIKLPITIRKGRNRRIYIFLIIPYNTVYNVILGKPFLATLDAMSSTVYMKVKHHNNIGEPIVISTYLRRAGLTHEIILKNPSASVVSPRKGRTPGES